MRGLGLKNLSQLDKLLTAPISQYAADHSEPPDEEFDLADRMYDEAGRQHHARELFDTLAPGKYVN